MNNQSQEEKFFSLLKDFFIDLFFEEKEKRMCGEFIRFWPKINFAPVLKKKINEWKKNPEALRSIENPRKQLNEFFQIEMWKLFWESASKAIAQRSAKGKKQNGK